MGSSPTITPANMELTPCIIKHGGVDLGGTHGNVKIIGSFKKSPIKCDQLGDTDIDYRVSGHEFKVETILTETKNKDRWKTVFPNAKRITAGNGAVYFESAIGQSDLTLALELLLHPMSIDAGNLDHDHKFYKAVAESASEVVFGPTEQQGLKVVWRILPDTSVNPPRFWFHGNPANGIVAAVVGTPSFVGTGDGTMGSVSAGSGIITEVITAVYDGALWIVTGSVSGALGAVATGSPFVSSKLNFTITAGVTPFVANDTFTVITTGANYS